MRLERFRLQGFAQHQDLDLTFVSGTPNMIIGPNEAGKSHLMCGLLGTLFGIVDPEPYRPWHGEPEMTGSLTLASGDDRVEIVRRFLDQQVEVTVNGNGVYSGRGLIRRSTAEDRRYQSLLHDWIGFSEPEVFERTVFVGQDLVQDQSLSAFSAQIKRLISGTREANYETAIKDLESELDTLIKLPGKRVNRQREDLVDRLTDLEQRHQHAEGIQRQVVTLVEEEQALIQKIERASETQERYSGLVERYGELQRQITAENNARLAWRDVQGQIDEMKRSAEQRAEHEKRRDQLRIPGDPEPESISALNRDIDRLQTRIEGLEQDVARNENLRTSRARLEEQLEQYQLPEEIDPNEVRANAWRVEQAQRHVDERRRLLEEARSTPDPDSGAGATPLRVAAIAFAAVVLVVSVGLGVLVDPVLFAGVLLALLVLAIPLVLARPDNGQRDSRADQIARCQRDLEAAEEELAGVIRRRDELLASTGATDLDVLYQRAYDYQQMKLRIEAQPEFDESSAGELAAAREELKGLETQRDELLRTSGEPDLDTLYRRASDYQQAVRLLEELDPVDEERLAELEKRLNDAQQEAAIARQRREDLIREHPEIENIAAERINEYREQVEQADRQKEEAERRLHQVRYERQRLGQGSEDAEVLRLEIDELRAEIDRIELLADAHQLAIETLQSSVREFQETALDPVGEKAGNYFGNITDGRYQGVTIDRDSMAPSVLGNGLGDIPFSRLSRGARDQLYLSIRAALVDALSGERCLPLVLDDPCVHFDEERLEAAASLIGELARERQILLFTKDETWIRWFDPVLRLQRQDASTTVR